MIFYFSGTGNSRRIALRLAGLTADKAVDIVSLTDIPDPKTERRIGLVFPVYAWGLPEPVEKFLERLPAADCYTFAAVTCGADAGHALKKAGKIRPLSAAWSVAMPNNYVIGSQLEEEETVLRKLRAADEQTEEIAREILEEKRVYRVHEGALPRLKSNLIHPAFNRFARRTAPFYATDACNGCGTCARNCPAKAIALEGGRPVWTRQNCFQCLRCLNACPQTAIQYGKATEKRRRYTAERYATPDDGRLLP